MRISDWSSDVCSSDLFGELGVDNIAFRRGATRRTRRGTSSVTASRRSLFGVDALHQLGRGLRQRFGLGGDRVLVVALHCFTSRSDGVFDRLLLDGIDLQNGRAHV